MSIPEFAINGGGSGEGWTVWLRLPGSFAGSRASLALESAVLPVVLGPAQTLQNRLAHIPLTSADVPLRKHNRSYHVENRVFADRSP